jgi:hypothetical protein
MTNFLLEMLFHSTIGIARSLPRAFTAMFLNSENARVVRLRTWTLSCFVAASALLVAAALSWSVNSNGLLHVVCGWMGVAVFEAFLVLGNRCVRESEQLAEVA